MKEKKINHPLRIRPSVIEALKIKADQDNRPLNNYIEVKLSELAGVSNYNVIDFEAQRIREIEERNSRIPGYIPPSAFANNEPAQDGLL